MKRALARYLKKHAQNPPHFSVKGNKNYEITNKKYSKDYMKNKLRVLIVGRIHY